MHLVPMNLTTEDGKSRVRGGRLGPLREHCLHAGFFKAGYPCFDNIDRRILTQPNDTQMNEE
jgi:hypothetical protein